MKQWGEPRKLNKILQPELLGQANIPKPLHGINPRTIMGANAWKSHRQQIIQNHPYCAACGLETLKLDLHEDYIIDYNKAIMKVKQYVPLCKDCHLFIHSGFLITQISAGVISRQEAKRIMSRGLEICSKNNVSIFVVGYNLAKHLNIDVRQVKSWSPKTNTAWSSWRLEYKNKIYKGLTKNEWTKRYSKN